MTWWQRSNKEKQIENLHAEIAALHVEVVKLRTDNKVLQDTVNAIVRLIIDNKIDVTTKEKEYEEDSA